MGKQCCHFFSAIVDQILFIFVSTFCLFCAFTRPIYQVSVYRTIGPLVASWDGNMLKRFGLCFFFCYSLNMESMKYVMVRELR